LDAIAMEDNHAKVDPDTCGDCGACVDACPNEAISCD
jgi:NAD-dependent dihydropyrimidine dehydrogenase PreA subunit